MRADARAAANRIVAQRKAKLEGCAARMRNAFICAPNTRLLFIIVCMTELITNTLIILFDVLKDRTTMYMSTHRFKLVLL